jgi:hypothetical protein
LLSPGFKKSSSAVSIILILLVIAVILTIAYFAYNAYVTPSAPKLDNKPANTQPDLGPLVQGSLVSSQKLSTDISRKADLDTLAVSLDTWKDEKGKYPEKSVCVESLLNENPGLDRYLRNGRLPADPDGPRTIGVTKCESGYYYQSFGDAGCILWGRMQSETGGVIDKTPEEIAADITAKKTPEKSSTGTYYIADRIDFSPAVKTPAPAAEQARTFDSGIRTAYSMLIAYPNIIDPRKFIFEIKPGESAEDFLILNNTSGLPAEFILYGADETIDPEGKVSYKTLDQEQNMVGRWITFDSDKVTVGPNNKQKIRFKVTVPSGIPLSEYDGGVAAELAATVINPYTNEKVETRYMMIVSVKVTDDPQPVVKKNFEEKVSRT